MRKGRYVQSERALSETSESGDTTGVNEQRGCVSGVTDREEKAPQTNARQGGVIRLFIQAGEMQRGNVRWAWMCVSGQKSPDFGLVFVGYFGRLPESKGVAAIRRKESPPRRGF